MDDRRPDDEVPAADTPEERSGDEAVGVAKGEAPRGPRTVDRRTLLALSGVAVAGGLAGCGGGGDGDGATSTPDPTSAEPTSTAPPVTSTAPPETSTAPTTAEPTSTEPQTTTAPTTTLPEPSLLSAPSSSLSPLEGFANADWLDEVDPEIIRVTSLADSGPGTLREAINTDTPRIVVFEVGGVIELGDSGLGTEESELFIAGQTAPSPGITITHGDLRIDADNMIVQHVRVRPGDGSGGPTDSMTADSRGQHIIFDHCTTTWSVDENMSTGGGEENHDVTFSNNLIAEGLSESIHPKGEHSKGSLIMNYSDRVSLLGNVWSQNVARTPRLKGGTSTIVVNNLAFNFDQAIMMGGDADHRATASIVGNKFVAGELTDDTDPIVYPRDDAETPGAYFEDNVTEPSSMPMVGQRVNERNVQPLWPWDEIEPIPSSEVEAHNLATAGARPADRTPHDERVLRDVAERNSGIIDSQSEVGGYPDLPETERALDPPAWGEGFTEWLFEHTLAVEFADRTAPEDR